MNLDCLDGLIDIINDQDTRTSGVLYLNDLPDLTFQDNFFKSSPVVYGDTTLGSPIITNLTFNSSEMDVDEYIISKAFANCTKIETLDSDTQITVDSNAVESCCQVPIYIKSRGYKLVQDKIEFAKAQLTHDLLSNLQGCMAYDTVIDNDIVGYWDDFNANTIQAASAKYKGVQVTINRYPYMEFYLQKLTVFFNTAVTDNIYVYDLIENRVIDTIAFTSVANQKTEIDVNTSYKTNKQRLNLLFYYDASLTGNYKTYVNKKRSSCKGCGNKTGYVQLYGAELDNTLSINQTNIERGGFTHGLNFTYSLNCTIEPFICSIRNLVQFPWFYKVAAELMKEAYYNPDRVNSYVTISRSDHKELWQEYENEYQVLMFGGFNAEGTKKIKQGFFDRLVLPSDICFKKRSQIFKRTIIP